MKPMILPITTETYAGHFTSRGWTSPQSQINAGFPYFIQPTNPTAKFVGVVDCGAMIPSTVLITAAIAKEDIVPGLVIVPTISLSADGVTYEDHPGVYGLVDSGFRYVKVTLDVTGGGTAIQRWQEVRVTVAVEEIRDAGTGTALAIDTAGTPVSFNKVFLDVQSITVTAKYQTAETMGITAIYDFDDVPSPTTFKVLLYSNLTGNRLNGEFSWAVKGT